ncbi:MAG: hypothetical protein RL417_1014 [Pseudomonadota bacterium]
MTQLLQETAETELGRKVSKVAAGKRRLTIVTGGQSGVDRAALDVALHLELPMRGWCPTGRWAEDGPIAPCYPLQETGSPIPAVRTELNVIDSDGTLVLSRGTPTDGTPLTEERAAIHGRPVWRIDLDSAAEPRSFWRWVEEHSIRILNIAGPRESFSPGQIYAPAYTLLLKLLDPTTA